MYLKTRNNHHDTLCNLNCAIGYTYIKKKLWCLKIVLVSLQHIQTERYTIIIVVCISTSSGC
jgi:hypothetical protein